MHIILKFLVSFDKFSLFQSSKQECIPVSYHKSDRMFYICFVVLQIKGLFNMEEHSEYQDSTFYQGLPCVGLIASCCFPYLHIFLKFFCSNVQAVGQQQRRRRPPCPQVWILAQCSTRPPLCNSLVLPPQTQVPSIQQSAFLHS